MKKQGAQLRKYLFYGLTLMLVAIVVFLAIQGRRMEEERMNADTEIVQKFDSTPIRALFPPDIEILEASMTLEPGDETEQYYIAHHRIEIRNTGNVSYSEIQLKLDYLGAGGEVLASIPYNFKKLIHPGKTFLLADVITENIPVEVTDSIPFVVFADMEPEETKP